MSAVGDILLETRVGRSRDDGKLTARYRRRNPRAQPVRRHRRDRLEAQSEVETRKG
jgi:hypothetical protein